MTSDVQSSKKRKAEPVGDSRFRFDQADLDNALEHSDEEDEEQDGTALAGPSSQPTALPSAPLPAHLLPASGKKHGTPGLIYFSRIPPGMGPAQIKHLLSAYGEVGRVFLARANPDPPQNLSSKKRQKDKHREHRFAEGWVEFMDKKVARSVAELLNANNIGGKKGSRFRDDVWTMKYLPRFRWDMLSEQVALERATQTSLLRFHLQNTRTEQESYLQAVEKARVKTAMATKAEGRREGKRLKGEEDLDVLPAAKAVKKERERTYKQREAVKGGATDKIEVRGGSKKDLDGVLSSLF